MESIIKTHLEDFTTRFALVGESETVRFEKFAIYSALSSVAKSGFSPRDLWVRENDFGIDGVAVVIDGAVISSVEMATKALESPRSDHEVEICLFEVKGSKNVDQADVHKFGAAISTFFSGAPSANNPELLVARAVCDVVFSEGAKLRNGKPLLTAFFLTGDDSVQSEVVAASITDFPQRLLLRNLFDEVRVQVLGANELIRLWLANVVVSHEFDSKSRLLAHLEAQSSTHVTLKIHRCFEDLFSLSYALVDLNSIINTFILALSGEHFLEDDMGEDSEKKLHYFTTSRTFTRSTSRITKLKGVRTGSLFAEIAVPVIVAVLLEVVKKIFAEKEAPKSTGNITIQNMHVHLPFSVSVHDAEAAAFVDRVVRSIPFEDRTEEQIMERVFEEAEKEMKKHNVVCGYNKQGVVLVAKDIRRFYKSIETKA